MSSNAPDYPLETVSSKRSTRLVDELPPPVLSSQPANRFKRKRTIGLKVHWDRFKDRVIPPSPSTTDGDDLDSLAAANRGELDPDDRWTVEVGEGETGESERVDTVVVDRIWSSDYSTADEQQTASPEKSGTATNSVTAGADFHEAPTPSCDGGLFSHLGPIPYDIWRAVVYFFRPRYSNRKIEDRYAVVRTIFRHHRPGNYVEFRCSLTGRRHGPWLSLRRYSLSSTGYSGVSSFPNHSHSRTKYSTSESASLYPSPSFILVLSSSLLARACIQSSHRVRRPAQRSAPAHIFYLRAMVIYEWPRKREFVYQCFLTFSIWMWPFNQILTMSDFLSSSMSPVSSISSATSVGFTPVG